MPIRQIPPQMILIAVLLLVSIVIIQIEIFSLVLFKLGLSPNSASILLVTTFAGSLINLPVVKVKSNFHFDETNPLHIRLVPRRMYEGHTLISLNVGGGLIPTLFSIYLITSLALNTLSLILAITLVSIISFHFSRPIANLGIGIPIFIAPLTAAIIAMILSMENAPALAYISGSLGVLIGADLMRIKDIKQLNAPIAAIGGAGTFDGIFITGIIAVLLTH